ncbi:L-glutamate gamma-semialdehyde dehydrogenase [Balamuthia mandrillaris]
MLLRSVSSRVPATPCSLQLGSRNLGCSAAAIQQKHFHAPGALHIPKPTNEPSYVGQEPYASRQKKALQELRQHKTDVFIHIGGEEIQSQETAPIRPPFAHKEELGRWHKATEKDVRRAIEASLEAKPRWQALPVEQRLSVFMKMASLAATKFRPYLNAATMLGQGKNAFQAEIDSACELVDFLQFNTYFAQKIYEGQPDSPTNDPYGRGSLMSWNRTQYRPLEGFVYAASPFNFTAIGLNLTTAAAMMGNTVVWKPSEHAMLAAHWIMELFREAGLPEGVINMVPGDPEMITKVVLDSPDLAGIHYTGSTAVFKHIWKGVANNIDRYREYPRLVGETGGKNYIFAHESADLEGLATAMVRGAYEFSGQKCSAASRAYIPRNIWPSLKKEVIRQMEMCQVGDPLDPATMVGPVIHRAAFDRIKGYIERGKSDKSDTIKLIHGGQCDDSVGYFVHPTLFTSKDPNHELMKEEIFGPVLTVYVYPEDKLEETLQLCERSSNYALTGSIWARDRLVIHQMIEALPFSSGNFYINDKPTGAVVGQQPFGGGRNSGTNDKAGAYFNLLRWVNTRSIKETFKIDTNPLYPYMNKK